MDENEFIKAIQVKLERMNEFDKKTIDANIKNRNEINDLVGLVNTILEKYEATERINGSHINFYEDFIGNILPPIKDKKLSSIIFNKYFPRPTRKTYFHFTSFEAAKGIVSTKLIRLSNLRKRFQDGEYSQFYSDHGIDGYKVGGTVLGIDCSEESIMSEIFFFSLTSSAIDFAGQSKWRDFGDNGYGVRLEFEVNAKHDDFREVFYSLNKNANCIPMLRDLFIEIRSKYSKPFNFTYSSKIGAFYIKGKYENENEFRFLIKRTSDDYNAYFLQPTITDTANKIAYIELPFSSEFAEFKIKSIQPGNNCSNEDIEKLKEIIKSNDPAIVLLDKAQNDY